MRFVILLTLISALNAQDSGPDGKASAASPAGSATNGKKIFESYGCYQCHGYEGQGGAGARLAPRPIAFPQFSRYVRQPTNQMPPYTRKVVSDQEVADIYAYLQTIAQPPSAKSIPILNH